MRPCAGWRAPGAPSGSRPRPKTQTRHFYDVPAYGTCDGLLYFNAHNDEEAVALYERAGTALDWPPARVLRLDHPLLRPALLRIARDNHLVPGP